MVLVKCYGPDSRDRSGQPAPLGPGGSLPGLFQATWRLAHPKSRNREVAEPIQLQSPCPPRPATHGQLPKTSRCLGWAFLTRRDHLHLGAAADGLASTVGAARVGALVPGPQVVDQQRAIRGLVHTVAVGLQRQPVPGGERMLGEPPGPGAAEMVLPGRRQSKARSRAAH